MKSGRCVYRITFITPPAQVLSLCFGGYIFQYLNHLFRSPRHGIGGGIYLLESVIVLFRVQNNKLLAESGGIACIESGIPLAILLAKPDRSEEHTSELQSRGHLV